MFIPWHNVTTLSGVVTYLEVLGFVLPWPTPFVTCTGGNTLSNQFCMLGVSEGVITTVQLSTTSVAVLRIITTSSSHIVPFQFIPLTFLRLNLCVNARYISSSLKIIHSSSLSPRGDIEDYCIRHT